MSRHGKRRRNKDLPLVQFRDNIARDEEEPAKETKEGQPGRKRREKTRKGAGRQVRKEISKRRE